MNLRKLTTDEEVVEKSEEENVNYPKKVFVMADENLSLRENDSLIRELVGRGQDGEDTVCFKYQGKYYTCQGLHFKVTEAIVVKLESRFDKCAVVDLKK